MPLKVTWKKGMRLSTEVFDALDAYNDENITLSNIIGTGGRYGLIPADKPFELSVNISNNVLEIVSLLCYGVTKSGKIVDINFDSNYTNTFDTRISIPPANEGEAFLLIVKFHDKQWREVSDMYSEHQYTFELIGENSPVNCDSLPVGLLVNQYGWRLDETEFVPPCLYTNAHPKYADLVNRAKLAFKSISDRCLAAENCVARHLVGPIWRCVADNYISIDKRQDALSPAELFASVQQVVTSFIIGCSIDEYVTLENAEPFLAYHQRPYDARHLYRDIEQGLELCAEISIKMEAVCAMTEARQEAPPRTEKRTEKPGPKPSGRKRWEGLEI